MNQGSHPGTAVITGSTRQDALPATAQALTGRLHALTIWPLSQGEIAGVRENLLQALRADTDGTVSQIPTSFTTRADYVDRLHVMPIDRLWTTVTPATAR